MNPIEQLSKELNIPAKQVQKTIQLLEEGGTVPFISRYRKEQTGGLDEVQILDIKIIQMLRWRIPIFLIDFFFFHSKILQWTIIYWYLQEQNTISI